MQAPRARSRRRTLHLQLDVLDDLGHRLDDDATVLDFGCGNAGLVRDWIDAGFTAHGCDLQPGPDTEDLVEQGVVHPLDPVDYRFPFPDRYFDAVVSTQVLEHVMDYPHSVSEIARVLKADGVSLHFFPSRYRPLETHTALPLGGVIQAYPWIRLWAALGIKGGRRSHLLASHAFGPGEKDHRSGAEAAHDSHRFLTEQTNYLSGRRLRAELERCFDTVEFCEASLLRHSPSGRGRLIAALTRVVPGSSRLYGTLWTRAVLLARPR